jgi:hypothetical protein
MAWSAQRRSIQVVFKMTRTFHFSSLLLTVLLLAAPVQMASAQGQVYVIESTTGTVKVGTAYALDDRITVPAGASIRIVMPSGKTQTIKGPYSDPAADLAKGQKANDGVMAWIKTLMQTGGSNERTPGATRSARAPAPPASFSWTAIPITTDSTICVEKRAQLELRRAPSPGADRLTLVDQTTAQRGEVEFAPGSETAPWPAGVTPRPDGEYVLLAPENRPRRQLTLRVLDSLPGEDDVLAELAARDCKYQFDAWVREKMSAGKRKPS